MLRNLSKVMSYERVGVDELAKILGVHRNTMSSKINGDSELTLKEIEIIKTIFNKYTWEYLFYREQEKILA